MSDIDTTPTSELAQAKGLEGYGSLEKGISGDYAFAVGDVISEAWEKTNGAKAPIIAGSAIYTVVYLVIVLLLFALAVVLGLDQAVDPNVTMESASANPVLEILFTLAEQVLLPILVTPVMVGIYLLGLRRAVDAPISGGSVLNYYDKIGPLAITLILMYLMVFIGLILLILPGIYLAIAYCMAYLLVVEKGLTPWEALEASRKAITHRWFAVFGLMILIALINLVAMIPLGIGLIWSVPFSVIAFGILYRNIFGCEAQTLAS